MSSERSISAVGAAAVVLLAVAAGVLAMPAAAMLAAPWGLRTALVAGELTLATPSLLVLVVLRRPLGLAHARVVGAGSALHALGFGLALWLASLGLMGLQQIVWPPPPGYLETYERLHGLLRPDGVANAVGALLAIAVAPAVCEELVFRGVAQPGLRPLLGPAGAALLSAGLFGAIHVELTPDGLTAWRVPFALGVGLGLAALRERSGRLAPSMVAHAGLNAVTWGLVAAFGSDAADRGTEGVPAAAALALVAGATAALLLLRWTPGRVPPEEAIGQAATLGR